MANQDAAFGFRPTRHLSGGDITSEEYAIAANHGTSIFTGQVVEAVAAGGIEEAAAGDTQQLGVFGGCFYTDPTTSKPTYSAYYPASTNASDIVAYVYADPHIVFEAQHDETGTAAMNHSGFDFVGTSGSTTTGISSATIDISTAENSDPSNPLMIVGIHDDVSNADHSAAGISYIVKINNHVFASSSGDADAAIS